MTKARIRPTNGTPLSVVRSRIFGALPLRAIANEMRDGDRGVDQTGVAGGDDGIDVEQDGEPTEAERRCQGSERAEVVGEGEIRPSSGLVQGSGIESADEGDLEKDVDQSGEQHRTDNGDRHVATRVVGLAGELDALTEAEVGEHDAARGDGGEDAVHAGGREAVGAEVRPVERRDEEGHDHEEDDEQLPAHERVVDPGEPAHAEVVHEHEHRHQDDSGAIAEGGQGVHGLAVDGVLVVKGAYLVPYCSAASTSIGAVVATAT